jgi:hypothetical protein
MVGTASSPIRHTRASGNSGLIPRKLIPGYPLSRMMDRGLWPLVIKGDFFEGAGRHELRKAALFLSSLRDLRALRRVLSFSELCALAEENPDPITYAKGQRDHSCL